MQTSAPPVPGNTTHQSTPHDFLTRPGTPPQSLRASISPPPPRARKSTCYSDNAQSHGRSAPLSASAFKDLYERNQHKNGRHFVIHQHDHPVAGVHYDLRLQINETSSISWAIMYGLPGNCNSRRLNRNATETRVHNIWVCMWVVEMGACVRFLTGC